MPISTLEKFKKDCGKAKAKAKVSINSIVYSVWNCNKSECHFPKIIVRAVVTQTDWVRQNIFNRNAMCCLGERPN